MTHIAVTPAPASTFAALATGSEYDSAVANLVEMGFVRDQVIHAMRAAFNNPDRAAEYLMTGIPESAQRPPATTPTTVTPAPTTATPTPATPVSTPVANAPNTAGQYVNLFDAAAAAAAAPNTAAPGGDLSLEMLRNSPQFQQLRQLVQQQPQLLQPLLQQIGQTNPELLQVCSILSSSFQTTRTSFLQC